MIDKNSVGHTPMKQWNLSTVSLDHSMGANSTREMPVEVSRGASVVETACSFLVRFPCLGCLTLDGCYLSEKAMTTKFLNLKEDDYRK